MAAFQIAEEFPDIPQSTIRNAVSKMASRLVDLLSPISTIPTPNSRKLSVTYNQNPNPQPRARLGSAADTCVQNPLREPMSDGLDRENNIRGADYQLDESLDWAKDFALFNPGTPARDFTKRRENKAKAVAAAWMMVATRIRKCRNSRKGTVR
jgi:hypothetical protein